MSLSLAAQKRMAMALLKCGQRKVWLDPTKMNLIKQARSREAVRDLIAQDIIQSRPGHRGQKTRIDNVLNHNNPILRRIKSNHQEKVKQAKEVDEFSRGSTN
eukprot:TRINITY_DN1687_c0_g1_i1.p2 TRINITY_DN1687_c0_g1~~TRINITY_DN1687_c0_g1_i1.p2  ORF type:complete len:102 (-),score=19.70 TRINITY_DN1687_c0_g1_i1:49-354(-)